MKVLPMSVDNVVATLNYDVVATLWKRSANVATMLPSLNFRNFFNVVLNFLQIIF